MKKALLADDDYLVRSYLKMLPAWEEAGFCIHADVRDGEEALDVLEKETIDLVVTDIAMPLIDGIQLIHEIRKRYKNIYIIALSCHDEFEYVKRAMQEGADEYILKNTLDEKSLYSILSVAMSHIEKRHIENKELETEARPSQIQFSNKKYLFFNQVLVGSLKGEEREQEQKKAGVKGIYKNSAVIVLKLEEKETIEDPWEEIKKEQYCLEFLERLTKEVDELLVEHENEREIIYIGNGVFCCFIDLSEIHKSSVMYQKLTSTASACYKICKKEKECFSIGVSNICIGFESLRQAYQQARTMVKMCFYEEGGIAYYENGKCVGTKLPSEAEIMIQQIDVFKYKHDRDGFQKMGEQAVGAFKRESTEKRLVFQWLRKVRRVCGIDEEEYFVGGYSIEKVIEVLKKIEENFFQEDKRGISEKVSQPVRIAEEYVANHFRESIGLNDAANVAGVNSTYLSYLFHQEMGIGFASYLLNLRIEYAKKILVESSLKMREISEKSGFNDYHYFSKVFKKMNGVSPAEYRKAHKKML